MKREPLDLLSIELKESGIEELDFSEKAIYKRNFKKFYFSEDTSDDDCKDLEEDEDIDVNLEDEDTEIEEEDLP